MQRDYTNKGYAGKTEGAVREFLHSSESRGGIRQGKYTREILRQKIEYHMKRYPPSGKPLHHYEFDPNAE